MIASVDAAHLSDDPKGLGRGLGMMFNSTGQERGFEMPVLAAGSLGNLFVDTAGESLADIFPDLDGRIPPFDKGFGSRKSLTGCFLATGCRAAIRLAAGLGSHESQIRNGR